MLISITNQKDNQLRINTLLITQTNKDWEIKIDLQKKEDKDNKGKEK